MNLSELLFPVVNGVTGTVALGVAFVAYYTAPKTNYLRFWVGYCATFALYTWAVLIGGGFAPDVGTANIVIRLAFTFGSASYLPLYMFSLSFAGHDLRTSRFLRVVVGWWMLMVALFWFTNLVCAGANPESVVAKFIPIAGPAMPLYLLYMLTASVGTVWNLYGVARRAQGLKKIQSGYVASFTTFVVVAKLGSLVPSALNTNHIAAWIPGFLLPMYPLVTTYAIARVRLWDVRTVLHKTMAWLLSVGLLVLPVYGALLGATQLLGVLPPFGIALLFCALFFFAHAYLRYAKPYIDHLFQRRRFDPAVSAELFARETVGMSSPEDLYFLVQQTLSDTLYSEHVHLIHYGGEAWKHQSVSGKNDFDEPSHDLTVFLTSFPRALILDQVNSDERFDKHREELNTLLAKLDARVFVPLVHRRKLLGILAIGEHRNLRAYSRFELEFLDRIGFETTKGLANTLLVAEVRQMAETLEERVSERTLELAEANKNLRELNRHRSQFFANITHELRTPLTMILAPVEDMLESNSFDQGSSPRHYLETIRGNGLRLLRLVNTLLDLAKMDEGAFKLHVKSFDVVAMLKDVIGRTQPLAQRGDVHLLFEPTQTRQFIYGDPEQIERVVLNLLANALKFTPSQGRVSVALHVDDDNVSIAVSDTGVGIAPDKLGTIFGRFRQEDGSVTRRFGGSGLGLSFAKDMVALHKGEIAVESEQGKGSTFSIRLRQGSAHFDDVDYAVEDSGIDEEANAWTRHLVQAADYRFLDVTRAAERRRVERHAEDSRRTSVLVVEDNLDILRFISLQLEQHHVVYVAENGRDGLDAARKHRPDVIVTDYMMPEMDGIQLVQEIRNDETINDTPIVMLTAKNESDDRVEARQAGADAFLGKPFSSRELREVVAQLLKRRGRHVEDVISTQVQSLERISAGLSHELHNPLTYIRNSLVVISESVDNMIGLAKDEDLSQEKLQKFSTRIDRMQDIAGRGVTRIQEVTDLLRRMAGGGNFQTKTHVLFDKAIEDATRLLAPKDGASIELSMELGADDATVEGVATDLGQVIRNLVQNAYDSGASEVWAKTTLEGDVLHFTVRDNGPGIPPEILDKVFSPFFTSKDPGKGMGLGLTITHQIVEDSGGRIEVHSRPGEGTRFRVTLPVSNARSDTVKAMGTSDQAEIAAAGSV